jgi:hypothetical protein
MDFARDRRAAPGLKRRVENPQSAFKLIELRRDADHAIQDPG